VALNTELVRRYVAALWMTGVLLLPGTVRAGAHNVDAAVAGDVSRVRIENFGRINAHYYRGGQPEGDDFQDLAALGVKTIVNLTSDDAQRDEEARTEQAGMKYFQIPMTTHRAPTAAEVGEFLSIVNDPANQPVFVHCVGGRHRTGVMTAVYRINEDGWSADQAFREMKQYKFGSDFLHPEFKEYVYGYRADTAVAAAGVKGAGTK
jgi:tyrosine-protein phosphatase SIW14